MSHPYLGVAGLFTETVFLPFWMAAGLPHIPLADDNLGSEKLNEIEPQMTLSSQINNVLDVLNRWTEKEGTCISANYF